MYNGAVPSTDVTQHVRKVVVHFAVRRQLTDSGSENFEDYALILMDVFDSRAVVPRFCSAVSYLMELHKTPSRVRLDLCKHVSQIRGLQGEWENNCFLRFNYRFILSPTRT